MKVEIYLQETSQRITFENATNTYTKGPLYCVYLKDENTVYKYPLSTIFNVKESYYGSPKPEQEDARPTPST